MPFQVLTVTPAGNTALRLFQACLKELRRTDAYDRLREQCDDSDSLHDVAESTASLLMLEEPDDNEPLDDDLPF